MSDIDDAAVRVEMFAHLNRLMALNPDGSVSSKDINTFSFEGRIIPLILQRGIRKLKELSAALAISTTYPRPNQPLPYEDKMGPDGLLRYKYQGVDPDQPDNVSLREAMHQSAPLAYFLGVSSGTYLPLYPVWIVAEEPVTHQFAVAVDEAQTLIGSATTSEPARAYVERLTKVRVHQPYFRTQVLLAYEGHCAMCQLHHARLLDGAHIIPDGEPAGDPIVPNGLSLCKIHHAAFDANILGIRPDLRIEVRHDILQEIDGPMLRYGLQGLNGERLTPPRQRAARPDPDRLDVRYQEFKAAS